MTNRNVAEAFAEGRVTYPHTAHLFIDGNTIYSYGWHFPIATKTGRFYQGKEIVLFNSRNYSVTTSAHKSHVWGALYSTHKYLIIEVPSPSDRVDADVIAYLDEKIANAEQKELRARLDWSKDHWQKEAAIGRKDKEIIKAVFAV